MFTSNQHGDVGGGCPVAAVLGEDIIPHHPQGVRGERGPWELIGYGIQGIHDGVASSVGVQLQNKSKCIELCVPS